MKYLTELLVLISGLFDIYLNYRSYTKTRRQLTMPDKFKAVETLQMDQTAFAKAREYNLDKEKFAIFKGILEIMVVLALLKFNYFSCVWNALYERFGGVYRPAFAFILAEQLRSLITEVPLSYYSNFVIEERHGFNKMTVTTFVTDKVKTFFISIIFQFIFFGAIVGCMERFREKFIVFAWVAAIAICCVYLLLFPTYIAPLFNKFEALNLEDPKEAAVHRELVALCDKLGFPLGKIYKIDGSKRSDHSQAYFFGFFGKKQIVIFDTLIAKASVDELVAVVGHELGHWYHRHNIQMIVLSFLNIGLILYVFSFMLENDQMYQDFGFKNKAYFMGLIMFFLLYSPLGILIHAIFCAVIRRNEYQADRFAVGLGKGADLLLGLGKLFKDNKAELDPDEMVALFRHTHPNLIDRTTAIKETMRKKQ
jgi:STE24 endopeptidase